MDPVIRRASEVTDRCGNFACEVSGCGEGLFAKIVFGAALDAGRSVRVLRDLGTAADHPVSVDHPEGRYLTGLLLEADC